MRGEAGQRGAPGGWHWNQTFLLMSYPAVLKDGSLRTLPPSPIVSLPFTDMNGCMCSFTPISVVSCDLCSPFSSKAETWRVVVRGGYPWEVRGGKGVNYLSFQRMPDMCLHFLPTFAINSFLTLRVVRLHVNLHAIIWVSLCVCGDPRDQN